MNFNSEVLDAFPGIRVCEGRIRSTRISAENTRLEDLKLEIIREIRSRSVLDQVKNDPVFRAYRDFFWSVGVDPTKTRPAAEALVRRILSGGNLPRINTAVDAYNLASVYTGVPIAAFDSDTLDGELTLQFAREGEPFLGIGMQKPVVLKKNQVVITDDHQTIAIYPYRDSDATKVTIATRNIWIITCGVPRIEARLLTGAFTLCAGYLEAYTGGEGEGSEVSPLR